MSRGNAIIGGLLFLKAEQSEIDRLATPATRPAALKALAVRLGEIYGALTAVDPSADIMSGLADPDDTKRNATIAKYNAAQVEFSTDIGKSLAAARSDLADAQTRLTTVTAERDSIRATASDAMSRAQQRIDDLEAQLQTADTERNAAESAQSAAEIKAAAAVRDLVLVQADLKQAKVDLAFQTERADNLAAGSSKLSSTSAASAPPPTGQEAAQKARMSTAIKSIEASMLAAERIVDDIRRANALVALTSDQDAKYAEINRAMSTIAIAKQTAESATLVESDVIQTESGAVNSATAARRIDALRGDINAVYSTLIDTSAASIGKTTTSIALLRTEIDDLANKNSGVDLSSYRDRVVNAMDRSKAAGQAVTDSKAFITSRVESSEAFAKTASVALAKLAEATTASQTALAVVADARQAVATAAAGTSTQSSSLSSAAAAAKTTLAEVTVDPSKPLWNYLINNPSAAPPLSNKYAKFAVYTKDTKFIYPRAITTLMANFDKSDVHALALWQDSSDLTKVNAELEKIGLGRTPAKNLLQQKEARLYMLNQLISFFDEAKTEDVQMQLFNRLPPSSPLRKFLASTLMFEAWNVWTEDNDDDPAIVQDAGAAWAKFGGRFANSLPSAYASATPIAGVIDLMSGLGKADIGAQLSTGNGWLAPPKPTAAPAATSLYDAFFGGGAK